jgi:hypothetical protein
MGIPMAWKFFHLAPLLEISKRLCGDMAIHNVFVE